MSSDGSLVLPWADGEHTFRLRIGELRALQEKLDAGPAQLARRLADGTWRVDDVIETIRFGLIGGGAIPDDVRRLVSYFVEGRPLMESVPFAQAILLAALAGTPDDSKKKPNRPTRKKAASTSPASTAPAPSLVGTPAASTA